MGQSISSVLDPDQHEPGHIIVPIGYVKPSFPSLYIPTLANTQREFGIYLYDAETIWAFTVFWNLILICGIFLLCSLLAAFSLLLSLTVFRQDPSSPMKSSPSTPPVEPIIHSDPTHARPQTTAPSPSGSSGPDKSTSEQTTTECVRPGSATRKVRPRQRPPLWPVFLIPLFFTVLAAFVSLITGTVIGFALATVYSAGGFSMSTWVPFLWALIQVLVLIISSYSTLTSIL